MIFALRGEIDLRTFLLCLLAGTIFFTLMIAWGHLIYG
jgi:hypothetical protein